MEPSSSSKSNHGWKDFFCQKKSRCQCQSWSYSHDENELSNASTLNWYEFYKSIPAPSKGCQLNPKGWWIDTLWKPFGALWKGQVQTLFFIETSLIPSTFYLRILGSCSHPPYPMDGDVLRSVRRFDSWRKNLCHDSIIQSEPIGFTRWRETAILWFLGGFPTSFLADFSSH